MIDYGADSQPGPRPCNEDAQIIRDLSPFAERLGGLLVFLAVSDGMGGHESGDVASRVAIEAADKYVDELIEKAGAGVMELDPDRMLAEIAGLADQAIVEAAQERGATSMGATFVGVFATADRAWIGHVGDSRAYLLRGAEALQLTTDHSAVGRMISEGVLTEEQAQQHPQRNVIERALGFGDGAGPESSTVQLQSNDVVLLCTDGVSTVLAGTDLADLVGASPKLRSAAVDVVSEAIRLGSDDNATVALWSPERVVLRKRGSTLTDASRRRARERRAAKRRARASRASYVIAAMLGVGVLALGALGVSGIGGGTGAKGAVAGRSATSSPRASTNVPSKDSAALPPPPQEWRVPICVWVKTSAWMRTSPEDASDENKEFKRKLPKDTTLTVVAAPGTHGTPKGWWKVSLSPAELKQLEAHGYELRPNVPPPTGPLIGFIGASRIASDGPAPR